MKKPITKRDDYDRAYLKKWGDDVHDIESLEDLGPEPLYESMIIGKLLIGERYVPGMLSGLLGREVKEQFDPLTRQLTYEDCGNVFVIG